jgi:hypothetical protein
MKNFNLNRRKKREGGKGKLEAESKIGHPKHKSVLHTLYQHIKQQSMEVPCTYDFQFGVEYDKFNLVPAPSQHPLSASSLIFLYPSLIYLMWCVTSIQKK